jgi:DNA-binding XRE family transcriptional regulator
MNGTLETRLDGVAHVAAMGALVVRFSNGRVYALSLAELEGVDASAVTGVFLGSDGYSVALAQASGNSLEIPWDVVLYHAEPGYHFYKHRVAAQRAVADRQEIGERIRRGRSERGWTLADLSGRTGIKIPNLSRLEKGKHLPSLETLEKVAAAFDLPVSALVSSRRAVGVAS